MIKGPIIGFVLAAIVSIAGCVQPVELELPITPQPVQGPTDEPPLPTIKPPPKSLIICLGREPESLYRYSSAYLYGDTAREAETVLQALYDGPIDIRNYQYQPVILEKLPNLADGDARVEQIAVSEGDLYFNPSTLQPDTLEIGNAYLPAGCESGDCILSYAGGTVNVDQMQADFRLRQDVQWSDGEPVTSEDSLFSYEVDAHVDTPTPKTLVDRTSAYEAIDPATVRWTGIPGYKDAEYAANFWSPLPEHLIGSRSPLELQTSADTNFSPVGWGPYVLDQWRPGQDITLTKNPAYHRASEELPSFDTLQIRFLAEGPQGSVEQLLTRECDILDESAIADALEVEVMDPDALALLVELSNAGRIALSWVPGAEMERLDFGLEPVPGLRRPRLFDDPLTRRAVASCINRDRILTEVFLGLSELPSSYVPISHPLAAAQVEAIEYDPALSNEQLEQMGWLDDDDDPVTPRIASGVPGVSNGTLLTFTLLTTPDEFHRSVASRLEGDLANCGIGLTPDFLPHAELFEPWPAGPAFGRAFEALSWAWPSWISPLCEMYASHEIPSDDNAFGVNASGFSDDQYDLACSALLLGRPDTAGYSEAVELTQIIFSESLPSIPLYMRPRTVAHRATICGVEVDPISFSSLWNLESISTCP